MVFQECFDRALVVSDARQATRPLKVLVAAVAERLLARMLAAAEEKFAVTRGDMLDRGKAGALVAAIAEGLIL